MTRIKICGLQNPADVAAAAACGADAIGFVFYPPSPRYVAIERARQLVFEVPPFVSVVGLFLDAEPELVRTICDHIPLDSLQFHGRETAEFCRSFARPYLKTVGMQGLQDIDRILKQYPDCQGFLLDSHRTGEPGGTGQHFDWSLVPQTAARPLILAGGLTPTTVGEAVRNVRPFGVDVSSGVEIAPGQKSPTKIRDFVQEVKRVDSEFSNNRPQ